MMQQKPMGRGGGVILGKIVKQCTDVYFMFFTHTFHINMKNTFLG